MIRLENTKANNADKHEPIALGFTWSDGGRPSVAIGLTAVEGIPSPGVGRGAPHWQSIQKILKESEPLTVAELQDRLHEHGISIKDNAIRGTLSRYPDQFKNVGSGNKGIWTTTPRSPELFGGQAPEEYEPPAPEEPPADMYEDLEDGEIF